MVNATVVSARECGHVCFVSSVADLIPCTGIPQYLVQSITNTRTRKRPHLPSPLSESLSISFEVVKGGEIGDQLGLAALSEET